MICKYFALLCYSNISSLASIVTFASLAFYQSRAKVDTLWPAAQRARAGKSGNDCFHCHSCLHCRHPLVPCPKGRDCRGNDGNSCKARVPTFLGLLLLFLV